MKYSMYDALVRINVPTGKAKAVIDAMEREMLDKLAARLDLERARNLLSESIRALELATKADFGRVRDALTEEIGAVKSDLGRVQDMLSKDIQDLSNAMARP
jgi:hypothetical protein